MEKLFIHADTDSGDSILSKSNSSVPGCICKVLKHYLLQLVHLAALAATKSLRWWVKAVQLQIRG